MRHCTARVSPSRVMRTHQRDGDIDQRGRGGGAHGLSMNYPAVSDDTAHFFRSAGIGIATFVIPLLALWGGFALWYQVPGGRVLKVLSVLVWALFSSAMLLSIWKGRGPVGFVCFVLAFSSLLIWWERIPPSNSREWADDVAKQVYGTVV